jgi:hypothetical protein
MDFNMAEYIPSFNEMIEQAKKEGRYHEGGRIGTGWGSSPADYQRKLLEAKMRMNGWEPGMEITK